MATSFRVLCFCGCGETVAASSADFSATTVLVTACAKLRETGVVSYEVRKSEAYAASEKVSVGGLRHRDGLVTFA